MKIDYKQALLSIFIGACVAFLSALLDGTIELLKNQGDDLLGGAVTTILYTLRHRV